MPLGRSFLWSCAAAVLLLISLFANLARSDDGPEEGQWSLVFYRGINRGVKCPNGIEGLVCREKVGGSSEEPWVTRVYTRDQFPLPLATCLQEGKILAENSLSSEARRLFGLRSVAPDRASLSNKPRGSWDMV